MRIGLFALLLIATPGLAQQAPVAQPLARGQPVPYVKPPAGSLFPALKPFETKRSDSSPASEALAKYLAYVKRCTASYDRTRNRVTVKVKISPDGKIVGEPDVASPTDSDEFRNDVAVVSRTLHQCEPLPVPPSQDGEGFVQQFTFSANHFDIVSRKAVREHFKKCTIKPPTGPDVTVELQYNAGGTYAQPPRLMEPQDNVEYRNAAAELIDQLSQCPPMEIPAGTADQFEKFTWTFVALDKDR